MAAAGTNTSVQFVSTSSTVAENVGTTSLDVSIANPGTSATTVDVAILSGNANRVNNYTTQTLTFPGSSSANQSQTITVTNNLLCDGNTVITFRLQNINGGQGTPFIVTSNRDHALTITDNDVCTGVSFAVTSATVSEGVGTYNVAVDITDFSTTQATSVDVALVSGNNARINGFNAQTVTFPANSGATQNVTLTVTDDALCNGSDVITLGLENLTGGQGTPFIGPNSTRTLTVTDNEATSGVVIARQAFDGLGSDTWGIASNSGTISTNVGATDVPANSRILSGTASWQVNNATGVVDLATVDVSGYTNMVAIVRMSATTTSGTNGLDAPDSVKVFVALNGAAFGTTADVAVRGNGNARWTYAGTQTATTTAGTFINVQSPGGTGNVNGPGTIIINIPDGTLSLALRVRARNNDVSEIFSVDDIQVTGDRCVTTYYSRATGNVGDAIWSETPTGTAGSASFSRFKSMVVQNGHTVTVNTNTRVNDFTVDAGGTLALGANTFTVSGDVVDVNGSMTAADNSTVLLNSTDLVTLESTSPLSLWDLTANTPGDVLTNATLNIRGTLLLQAGEFDASLGAVSLISNSTSTGRLGPVAGGASYTGNMRVERYIPGGATNWRLLGSPLANRVVGGWQDDFITAGYPGSQYPNFDDPVGSGILWPSIRWYDETNTGAAQNDGLTGVSSNLQPLTVGQGFAAWSGDASGGTAPFVVDLQNGTPNIASTPIALPMTYTNTGNGSVDGWNLVSNPLPSAIAFDQIARGADVADYVTFYNPANGNTGTYDISLNLGTNGGSNVIQSSQGFFLRATGSNVTTTVEEADKVNSNTGGVFGGNNEEVPAHLRLRLASALNAYTDEAVVAFQAGTPGLDGEDVEKYVFAHLAAPQIATLEGTTAIAINAHGAFTGALDIPVSVNAAVSGNYTISLTEAGELPMTCLTLEDTELGITTVMNDGGSYTFSLQADDDATVARFVLHASAPIAFASTNALCGADPDGGASVTISAGAADVTWTNGFGETLLAQTAVSGEATIGGLGAGSYEVHVSTTTACGALVQPFIIDAPFVLEAIGDALDATCADSEDGSVDLLVMGGVAPYTYAWSDASTDADLVAAPGSYTVTVTDANGCTWTSGSFTIGDQGPDATIGAALTSTTVNNALQFTSTAANASHAWDFGDGATSTEMNTEHAWTLPGTYTVTHTVATATCTVTTSVDITVELNTSVSTTGRTATRVFATTANIVVDHAYTGSQPLFIEVLDATGRVIMQRKVAAMPGRVNLASDALSTGVWFVRLSQGDARESFRVPLVR